MANEYFVNSADLTSVADAIRTKGETTKQIVFPDGFVTAIMAIQSGGVYPQLIVTAPEDSTITAVNGEETVTGVIGAEGTLTLDLPAFGMWMVTAALDGQEASASIRIEQEYPVSLTYLTEFAIDGVAGESVTINDGETTLSTVTLGDDGTGTIVLSNVKGKAIVFTSDISTFTKTITVGAESKIDISMYPDGALYWHGKEFEEKTGGWVSYTWTSTWYTGTGTVTKNDSSIKLSSGSMKLIGVRTDVKTLFAPESTKTLYVNVLSSSTLPTSNLRIDTGLVPEKTTAPYNSSAAVTMQFATKGKVPLDVSSVEGEYYIAFSACSNSGTSTLEFDEVWVE